MARRGILFIKDDAYIGSTYPKWYHSTFHAPWYINEHWTGFLAIKVYIHEGADTQDLVVLERGPETDPLLAAIEPVTARATAQALTDTTTTRSNALNSVRSSIGALVAGSRLRVNTLNRRIARLERTASMLRVSLYQQGERIPASSVSSEAKSRPSAR